MSSHGDSRRDGALARIRPVRLFFACLATWLAPFCFFTLFMYVTPLPAPFDEFPLLDSLVTLYVVGCGVLAAGWITRRYLALDAQVAQGAAADDIRDGVRRVIGSLPWIVIAYFVFGTALSLLRTAANAPIGLQDFGTAEGLDRKSVV